MRYSIVENTPYNNPKNSKKAADANNNEQCVPTSISHASLVLVDAAGAVPAVGELPLPLVVEPLFPLPAVDPLVVGF